MTQRTLASTLCSATLLAFALPLTGCASSGKTAGADPPEAALTQSTKTSEPKWDNSGFFDPFAAESSARRSAERKGQFVETTAASPEAAPTRPWANSGGISVYGEVRDGGPTRPEYDGAENLAQVTFAPVGADFDPVVSPDGRWLAFSSTRHNRTADLYLQRVGSRTVTQLTADPANDVMPTFSPDGGRLAFSSDRAGSWDIYLVDSGGGQAVQLTDDSAEELHPSWSPDGSQVAFCRLGPTSGRWELWVVDVNRPGVKRFIAYGLFPEWSPRGDKILFQRPRERGDRLFSVWTIDIVNGEGVRPTEIASSASAAIVNPTWSPDGTRIAFAAIPNPSHSTGERPEGADLWISQIDGGGRANLTGGRYVNLMPAWGPGNRIFFISDRGGRDNIWSLIPNRAIIAAQGPGAADNLANAPTNDED